MNPIFLIILTFVCTLNSISQTGITQTRTPGTLANISRAGSTTDWNNLAATNVESIGDGVTNTRTRLNIAGQFSDYIYLSNFGFTIPVDSRITSISFTIRRRSDTPNGDTGMQDQNVFLFYQGSLGTTNVAQTATWSNTFANANYSGGENYWNVAFSPTNLNNANFGIYLSIRRNSLSANPNLTAEIDVASMTITYNSTLPVELISFQGERIYNGARELSWSTATEINSDKFLIQRRFNEEFRTISEVKSVGNSTSRVNYSFADYTVTSEPILYYRLVQVDYNGDSKTYDPISIKNPGKGNFDVYPNPASNELHIRLDEESADEPYTFIVFDNRGTVVLNRLIFLSEIVDITNLNNGVYYVSLMHGEKSFENKKLIIE